MSCDCQAPEYVCPLHRQLAVALALLEEERERRQFAERVVGLEQEARAKASADFREAEAALLEAREWIDTVGRSCPSNATVDAFLGSPAVAGPLTPEDQ